MHHVKTVFVYYSSNLSILRKAWRYRRYNQRRF